MVQPVIGNIDTNRVAFDDQVQAFSIKRITEIFGVPNIDRLQSALGIRHAPVQREVSQYIGF